MKIWTVANQKGGVGKTTSTITLGGLLADQGFRVLLIDTDPHASLSYYFGIDSEDLNWTVYNVFTENNTKADILENLCSTQYENVDVLPATIGLATLDRVLGNKEGMGLILKKALMLIDKEYDYVLIDCPPVLGILMINALATSDRIIVPAQTEFLALKGLERMMGTLELMQGEQTTPIKCTIVPTMFDKRTKASALTYKKLKETYLEKVWSGVIPIDTNFRNASQARKTPSDFLKKSRGVIAYKKLLQSLISSNARQFNE